MIDAIKSASDFIGSSNFWSLLVGIAFVAAVVIVFYSLVRIAVNAAAYSNLKLVNLKLKNNEIQTRLNNPYPLGDKLEVTNSLGELISNMIDYEVMTIIQTYFAVSKQYEVSKMDEDIRKISSNVFSGIKTIVYDDKECIWTKEYIMQYITKKSTQTFLANILNYNTNLRSKNNGLS